MRGEIAELALGIDQDDGGEVECFLDDLAQGAALAGPAASLNEEASRHQPLELVTELASRMGTDGDRSFVGRGVEGKESCHAGISWARPYWPHSPSNPLPFPEIGTASCRAQVLP